MTSEMDFCISRYKFLQSITHNADLEAKIFWDGELAG